MCNSEPICQPNRYFYFLSIMRANAQARNAFLKTTLSFTIGLDSLYIKHMHRTRGSQAEGGLNLSTLINLLTSLFCWIFVCQNSKALFGLCLDLCPTSVVNFWKKSWYHLAVLSCQIPLCSISRIDHQKLSCL